MIYSLFNLFCRYQVRIASWRTSAKMSFLNAHWMRYRAILFSVMLVRMYFRHGRNFVVLIESFYILNGHLMYKA